MAAFSVKNPRCDGVHCQSPDGEVRMLPYGGDGNMILCWDCYLHEITERAYLATVNEETDPYLGPRWADLKVYDGNK